MMKMILFVLPVVWNFLISVAIADDGNECSEFSEFMLIDSKKVSEGISYISNLKSIFEDSKMFGNVKTSPVLIKSEKSDYPRACFEVQAIDPGAKSGVYKIWPRSPVSKEPIDVYCDLEDDGGAWTVIQRRGDFGSCSDYFYKDWESYKVGFGDPEKDHWIGNDNIFALTNQKPNVVKITLSDWEGTNTFASYDEFWIEDESRNYTLHVSGFTGTAGDSFSYSDRMSFTTKDRDNDHHPTADCANFHKGAWWYKACTDANLNGMYLKEGQTTQYGVYWYHLKNSHSSLKDITIKIRPKYFKKN